MLLDWMRHLISIANHKRPFNVILEGPPQSGKTYFGRVLADHMGARHFKFSCSESLRPEELFFRVVAPNNMVSYQPTPILEAFEASNMGTVILVIDEFDKTRERAEDLFLSAFEDWSFRLPTGMTIEANPDNMMVVMASNARRELREETLRRFPYRLRVGFPSKHEQVKILGELCPSMPHSVADYLIRLATALRKVDPFKAPSYGELVAMYEAAAVMISNGASISEVEFILRGTVWKSQDELPPVPWRWARGLVNVIKEASHA